MICSGAAGQRAIGTVVFGGMLASTLLAIPFVPVFYVFMQRLAKRGRKPEPATQKKDPIVDKAIEPAIRKSED
jgi:HAE1 family hydrophobic/amphiphilic exporter-1